MSKLPSKWIQRPKPNENASLRLFCIPHAGGSSIVYRTWPRDLPDEIEVCAVELPGHGRRISENLYTDLGALVPALVDEVLPFSDRPYALFGHSFGSLVCFEVLRELRTRNAFLPLSLCVSGAKAPDLIANGSTLHNQPDSVLIDELHRLGGTPEVVLDNEEMVSAILPALRADFEMTETYVYAPEAPLSIPILALAGSADPKVDRKSLQAWEKHTSAEFQLHIFPGKHFYFFEAQAPVLQTIAEAIDRAQLFRKER